MYENATYPSTIVGMRWRNHIYGRGVFNPTALALPGLLEPTTGDDGHDLFARGGPTS